MRVRRLGGCKPVGYTELLITMADVGGGFIETRRKILNEGEQRARRDGLMQVAHVDSIQCRGEQVLLDVTGRKMTPQRKTRRPTMNSSSFIDDGALNAFIDGADK